MSYVTTKLKWYGQEHGHHAGGVKGLVLVVHGLNLKSERMESLIDTLTKEGYLALNMTLAGHHGPKRHAYREDWLANYHDATQELESKAKVLGHPPCFGVCMSLGALTFLDFLTETGTKLFNRAVLLAPALSLRWYSHIFRGVSDVVPLLPIPSFSRPSDRVFGSLPLSLYAALYKTQDALLKKLDQSPLTLPLEIYVDARDELVSPEGLRDLIRSGSLPEAHLHIVRAPWSAGGSHHLQICYETMGDELWQRVTREIDKFFSNH